MSSRRRSRPTRRRGLAAVCLLLATTGHLAGSCASPVAAPSRADDPLERVSAADLRQCHFDELSWSELTETAIPLPADIDAAIRDDAGALRFQDRKRFVSEVMDDAARMGYDQDAIATLSPREAVLLAVDLVTGRLDYVLVDDEAHRDKYPIRLFPPIDLYYHEREGDCDKYRDLVKAVFSILKRIALPRSPALANVHVVSQDFGGRRQPHAWNAVVLGLPGPRIEIAHIDPTWYDGGQSLDGDERHTSERLFRLALLTRVGDTRGALEEIRRIYGSCDAWTREELLARKATLQLRLAERGLGDYDAVLSTYQFALVSGHDRVYSPTFDRVLAAAVRAYAALDRPGPAWRTMRRLEEGYPRSWSLTTLRADRALMETIGWEDDTAGK